METIFADDDGFDWDEYFDWMYDDEAYEDDYAPDLYDQFEYMMEHNDAEE